MSKEEFEGTLRSYGFIEDYEFKGVYKHEDSPIYTWFVSENEMAINWGMEYTVYRNINEWRLIALHDLFKKH